MSMNVDLSGIDLAAFLEEQAARERGLLALATRQPTKSRPKDKPDAAAAHELLLWFATTGGMTDPVVNEAVLAGMRDVAAYVVNKSILSKDGDSPRVHALMFFNGVDAPAKRGVHNKVARRLALVAAHGADDAMRDAPLMTLSELREALTTRLGAEQPRHEWPRSMQRAEARAIEFLERKYRRTMPEECRWYVHASFDLRWADRDADFPYPDEWK